MSIGIYDESSRKWLDKHFLRVLRYVRRNFNREDHDTVLNLIYNECPAEGCRLIQNFDLSNEEKITMFVKWLIYEEVIFLAGLGDQRQGKDFSLCYFFDKVREYIKEHKELCMPRFVTLGNIKAPPYVATEDMYFSFVDIPCKQGKQEVWIYCSEIETVIPAREAMGSENKLFSQIVGTCAQNGQKLFGLSKLASKVDIDFFRVCNTFFFKYISPDKLLIKNTEREGIISDLGNLLLPKDKNDKTEVLLSFNKQLFNVHHPSPEWATKEYSEQFRNIAVSRIWEFIEVQKSNGMDINSIRTAVAQKFRYKLTLEEIAAHFNIAVKEKKVLI